MKKIIVLFVALGALLSGCVVDPGRHHGDHDGHGDKGFCPPGQAKKGNC